MRLTIVGPAFPQKGGIAHHVYWLQRELGARGHEIQTISFRKLYPTLLLRLVFRREPSVDTSRTRLERASAPLLVTTSPLSWLIAARAIRAFAPDGVIIQWWNPFFAPALGTLARLVRRGGAQIVFECHNIFPHERSVADGALLRFALAPAHAFLTHSRQVHDELMTVAPGRPTLVAPLPVIQDFAAESRGDRRGRVLLFFGLVRKYKGLEVLLAALPKVLDRVECRLIVAGEFYEPIQKYEAMVRELGLEERVRLENRYIPNEEVPRLFARADVLVMPYHSATQSGVVQMAFLNRLPIIASRTGGLAEEVTDGVTGLLFPPGDVDALAEQLIRYFEEGLGPVFARNLEGRAPCGLDVADALERLLARRGGDSLS